MLERMFSREGRASCSHQGSQRSKKRSCGKTGGRPKAEREGSSPSDDSGEEAR